MSEANMLKIQLEWKLVGPDEWEYANPVLLKPVARVTYLQPNERTAKGFKFEAMIGTKALNFRTIAGAKNYVENWCIQKGKIA
jgi:hypothetical protein